MYKYISLISCFILFTSQEIRSQSLVKISLAEAVILAKEKNPSILVNQLDHSYKEKLSQAGVTIPNTQISISGDEFNFDGISGVQSLNVQQIFNLPKRSRAYAAYYKAQMQQSVDKMEVTEKEITRNVSNAYYRLVYAKEELKIRIEEKSIYSNFYTRALELLKSGETGKIPSLSAAIMIKKSDLELGHAEHEVEVAKELLNLWLGTDQSYDSDDQLPGLLNLSFQDINEENPHLGVYATNKIIAQKNIDLQKANRAPQIIGGLKLQSVNSDLLFFGYQAGVSLPLFNRSSNRKIEAAQIKIGLQDAKMQSMQKNIIIIVTKLKNHLEHLQTKVIFYDNDLIPALKDQMKLLKEAYQAGEGSYLEYMSVMESYVELRYELNELMEEYYNNVTELNYWTVVQ